MTRVLRNAVTNEGQCCRHYNMAVDKDTFIKARCSISNDVIWSTFVIQGHRYQTDVAESHWNYSFSTVSSNALVILETYTSHQKPLLWQSAGPVKNEHVHDGLEHNWY